MANEQYLSLSDNVQTMQNNTRASQTRSCKPHVASALLHVYNKLINIKIVLRIVLPKKICLKILAWRDIFYISIVTSALWHSQTCRFLEQVNKALLESR